ncbi:hypothetical protein E4U42_002741 [Claviceps africana]|uniref:Uncharacterized protein n=1 Tax=Claviceps africana TaxID=83212 RepID=A0A8K0NPE7_9HYPO|nr:hypothetical protein E4U42_002741 [Claviceps africana]
MANVTENDMSYLYTIGGYAAVFGVGYAAYRISTRKGNKRATTVPSKGAKSPQAETRKEDRKKKQRLEHFASGAHDAAKAKAKPEEVAPWPRHAVEDTSDDGVDNREFARQLAKAKEGKKFASKAESSKRKEKSVKQSQANKINNRLSDDKPSDAGADADADDDQSPIESPEIQPADVAGVSDMLEPAPAGPSVLRITDADKVKEKKPKAAKAPEKTETKKQRQNRKKAEAAKEAREVAEKERKSLEEKQRRTARIAEGRAAKDGSQFSASTNGANSWTNGAPSEGKANPSDVGEVLHQPLDTREEAAAPAAAPAASPAKKPAVATKPKDTWMSSLPSEEEQIEMLKDEGDEWSTVPVKASKKAKKSIDSGDDGSKRPAAQPHQAAKPSTSGNFGSFSALKDETTIEAEDEEEWDV